MKLNVKQKTIESFPNISNEIDIPEPYYCTYESIHSYDWLLSSWGLYNTGVEHPVIHTLCNKKNDNVYIFRNYLIDIPGINSWGRAIPSNILNGFVTTVSDEIDVKSYPDRYQEDKEEYPDIAYLQIYRFK